MLFYIVLSIVCPAAKTDTAVQAGLIMNGLPPIVVAAPKHMCPRDLLQAELCG